jgi:hypothetical protein
LALRCGHKKKGKQKDEYFIFLFHIVMLRMMQFECLAEVEMSQRLIEILKVAYQSRRILQLGKEQRI